MPSAVSTSRSSPSSSKEPTSSQFSDLISICLSRNRPEFISNLHFPWMCEAFNKTQSEEMKDLSVCPQRCPLRGQRGTRERKPGLFFMAAAGGDSEPLKCSWPRFLPACPRCHRRGHGTARTGRAGQSCWEGQEGMERGKQEEEKEEQEAKQAVSRAGPAGSTQPRNSWTSPCGRNSRHKNDNAEPPPAQEVRDGGEEPRFLRAEPRDSPEWHGWVTSSSLASSPAKHSRASRAAGTAAEHQERLGRGKAAIREGEGAVTFPRSPPVPVCRRAGRRRAGASPNKREASAPHGTIGALPGRGALPVPWLLMSNFNFFHKQLIELISLSFSLMHHLVLALKGEQGNSGRRWEGGLMLNVSAA